MIQYLFKIYLVFNFIQSYYASCYHKNHQKQQFLIDVQLLKQMSQADLSNVAIKIIPPEPVIFQMQSQEVERNVQSNQNINQNDQSQKTLVNRWQIGGTIALNFLYLLMMIILPIPSASLVGKYLLISFVLISYIIYLTITYCFSRLNFIIWLKTKQQYDQIYRKYTNAECILNFTYAPTRNNIDQEVKKYSQEYEQIKVVDKSQQLYPLQGNYNFACIKYHKKYYYTNRNFKGQIMNAFNIFIEKCKSNYDKYSRRLLRSRQKIELVIIDFEPEVGFNLNSQNHLRWIYFVTFGLGFSAYFEYYMRDKVLRKQIDIIKEICPK